MSLQRSGFRSAIQPKVRSDGTVRTQEDIAKEAQLTLKLLEESPRGFLKEYWPVVNEAKRWIFSEIPNRQGYASDFGEARKQGKGSRIYQEASNKIKALATEYLNLHEREISPSLNRRLVTPLIINEILGMSIITPIWESSEVKEVYVNGPSDIQVETDSGIHRVSGASFENQEHATQFCVSLLSDYNKSFDTSHVIAESRLADGSRFEAVHVAIAPAGPDIDIRRHDPHHWSISDIVKTGMASREMLIDLERYMRLGMSGLVIGGTSTGKTTILNALTGLFPNNQRIITIEDTLELNVNPNKLNAAPMEAREAGLNGSGEVTIRQLVKTSLRLSPSIVIIGETRGAEAYDLVNAANTGHQVFSTIHANNASHAISRVEMAISQGGELMGTGTFGAIQSAFALIIEITKFMRFGGQTRRIITGIHEVSPHITKNAADEPVLETIPLWKFIPQGDDGSGNILGTWQKVNEISPERRNALPDYQFQKNLTWDGLLKLEGIPPKDRMFEDDTPLYDAVGHYLPAQNGHRMAAPVAPQVSRPQNQ